MNYKGISAVNFNMATLQYISDLAQPLETVRNIKVVDRLPLLFLDEFDSLENFSHLLPLMWDGELHIGHGNLKLGKVVIVLAANNPDIKKTMKEAKNMQKEAVPNDNTKIADLLSRINGGIFEIPDLDLAHNDRDRRVDKVCLTIALLQQKFGPDLKMAPWSLLRFIALSKFRYGVRSIAHLIDLIPNIDGDRILNDGLKLLPLKSERELKNSSLAYHLIAESEPDMIVDMWNDISKCKAYVRFYSEPHNNSLNMFVAA